MRSAKGKTPVSFFSGPSIEISEMLPVESHLSKSQSDSGIVIHTQMHDDGRGRIGEPRNEDGRLFYSRIRDLHKRENSLIIKDNFC